MKLLLVREKWNHMSEVSGFDLLFTQISKNQNLEVQSIFVNQIDENDLYISIPNPSRLNKLKNIFRVKNELTHLRKRLSLPFEISRFKISPFSQIIHEWVFEKLYHEDQIHHFDKILFSVAENQFGYSLYAAPLAFKKKVILFFHQPPSWLKLHWRDFEILNQFAAIVTLSEAHELFFRSKVTIPIIRINHGVDLSFFKPNIENFIQTKPQILFVGSWLRDLNMLYQTNKILVEQGLDFSLNCIIPFNERENDVLVKLAQFSNVNFFAMISPEELRLLYQTSSLLFLPLIDSTANNGLNEAISCGLPVVATSVGGVEDYLGKHWPFLAEENNVKSHADMIMSALNWKNEKSNVLELRNFAMKNLDWVQISNSLIEKIK